MRIQVTQVGNVSLYFIGDVYGRLDKLNELLEEIDFDIDDDQSSIQFVKLVFCGNMISTKPQIDTDNLALLTLITRMVKEGFAYCLLGKNEFDAIGWSKHHPITDTPLVNGLTAGNDNQVSELDPAIQQPYFLSLFEHGDESIYQWIDWFMSLPLYLDFGHIRAIHACWDQHAIDAISNYTDSANSLAQQYWPCAFDKHHQLCSFLDIILNFPSLELTEEHPHNDLIIPVIVGHYRQDSFPDIQNEYVACVDYNAAEVDYPLVSFAWHQGRKKQLEETHASDTAKLSLGEFCFVDQPTAEEHIATGVESLLANLVEQLTEPAIDQDSFTNFKSQVDNCLWQDWDPNDVYPDINCRNQYQNFVPDIAKIALATDSEKLCAYLAIVARYQLEIENDNLENRCLKVAFKLNRIASNYLKNDMS
ncbi:metallophosphoesterase family protein [Shewanella donghaensis]|uniref:hypothetical protein n=1 Tax=Shewanella donghaensis TaxID=238836 RepID=UPI001182406B|nr:hypothetical protein [Shewanella donghaensis]